MATTDKRPVLATLGVGALLLLCCAAPGSLRAHSALSPVDWATRG